MFCLLAIVQTKATLSREIYDSIAFIFVLDSCRRAWRTADRDPSDGRIAQTGRHDDGLDGSDNLTHDELDDSDNPTHDELDGSDSETHDGLDGSDNLIHTGRLLLEDGIPSR